MYNPQTYKESVLNGEKMIQIVCVAVAGASGALCRWAIGRMAVRLFGANFPYGTLIVNVLGCFLIGLIMHIALASDKLSPTARLTLTVGFLGALTTFSSFSYETVVLIDQARWTAAGLNIGANLFVSLAATFAGLALGRILVGGTTV
jgi:fluoride exporter